MSQMKPILFNTEMVRAIMDGRKTGTRRAIPRRLLDKKVKWANWQLLVENRFAPYHVGDILYVRETFVRWIDGKFYYKADPIPEDKGIRSEVKWSPSIHMPKEAARIFLRVTNVRVERLQDMDAEEAEKEGVVDSSEGQFANLWNSTIPKKDTDRLGWEANPWVWVYEFECCEKSETDSVSKLDTQT